jgi:hypothetical protein
MSGQSATHEDFSRSEEVHRSSNRSFGLVFSGFFLIVALWPLLGPGRVRWWAVVLAGVFFILGVAVPSVLGPLNMVWGRIGLLLHGVAALVAMGVIFYGTVTLMGVVMRFLGKDPMRARLDREATTYWIERRPPGPAPQTMRAQF